MSDGDRICEAIAQYLREQTFTLKFETECPDNPEKDLQLDATEKQHEGVRCWLVPVAKSTERLDRQGIVIRWTINVFVSRFLHDGVTRKRMSSLVDEIETSLRLADFVGYKWDTAETIVTYDVDKLRVQNRFLSVLSLTLFDAQ